MFRIKENSEEYVKQTIVNELLKSTETDYDAESY